MQDNNTPIFRVSLANGASRDYTEQEYRDLHIADWLNENHSGKYNVFRLNDAAADSVTKDQQYVVSFTQDGQTKSKLYSGQDFMDLDMGNWLEQNHSGNYKIQSVRGYSDANLAADEDYWKKKANEQKAAISQFDQDNHDFMFKHEMDKIVYDAGEGNIVDDNYMENDAKYRGLVSQKQKLQAELANNPYVQSLYKSEAEYADGKANEYDGILEEMRKKNPFLGASKQMQSGTQAENDEFKYFQQAKKLEKDVAKTFAIETVKAPGENGFADYMRNYAKAHGNTFSDVDFWSRGLTEISRNLNIRDIMKRLQDKGLDLNQLSEKDLDDNLTPGEKALLQGFVRKAYAQAQRAEDMAPGYTAGRTAAESLGFMAEFLVTGAIGRGLGAAEEAGATGLKSWIARELRTGSADAIESSVKRGMINAFTKGGEKALTEGAKKAVVVGSKAASGAYSAVVRPIEGAVWHTALQPSTYRQISENLTQIQENGELIDAGNAIWGGVLDQLVENWSESMGGAVETVLGMPFKAAGWAGEKVLGKTTLGQWGKWLADTQAARVLHNAGFNGLIGEMGEEWLGNAARVGLGLMSGDEFKNFASWHEQLEMAASFAPMSLFGLGTSAYAASKQAKDYKQTAEAMRGVLNRAGMTEDEIADIMDTKHTKKEIADALTPVIQRIVHGRQDNSVAFDDYVTTLKFAQASAMNEVLATAQSIERGKERDAMRSQIGQELGATSAEDERGKFTHVMNSERLDADGNPYELEAVTTVKDADGNEWFYMGNQGSQVVLKKMGEDGGKPMFLTQEQYAQRVESGEYTENTQLATQYLDQRIEQQRAEEERVRKNQEVQDNYSRILAALQQNPEITVGPEDAPMTGTVAQVARDGVVVDFGQPVLLNGVTRPVHKLSLEQAGNALGIDAAMRSDEQMDRDSADQDYLNRKRISAYNNTFKDKDFTLNGDPYTFVRMFEAPYLDEDGTELVKVTATDAMGNDVELVLPLKDLEEQALTSEEQAQADADQEDVNLSVTDQTTGSLKDFRGNDIPMRQNEKTGEEEVDKREFKRRDPEAYYRWNDSRRGGNTSDSMEAIQADIAVKTSEKDKLAAQKQSETDPDTRDELEAQITNLDNEINLLSGIYHKYDAASNFQQRQAEYAQRFADIKQRMLKAKTQDQYDELVEMQRQLSMDYFTEMRDAAQTLSLNQHAVELQQALNEMADLPVQVTTYARIEEDMINNQASRASIDKVLDKIASVQRENMATGSNLAIDGFHHNGKVYIFAEGNRTVADATVTYYHERQHDINETNPKAVDDVLALANNDEQALYDTLTHIIGNAKSYEGVSARVLADEIVAFTMEKAWTNPNYVDELKALGLSNELINIISTEYGRQQGTSEDLNQRSGDRTSYDGTGGQPDYRINEQAQEGESGDEQLGSSQPGNEAEEVGLTEKTQKELAEKGLVIDGGVVMASALSDLKQATGYLTPNEISPEADAVAFSIRTKNAWAANYRKYPGSEERVIRALENLAERMAADELVSGVVSQGSYKYGKKDKGSFAGPLRTNIEYVVTFDMDTTCPRTFQYLNYVKQIEKRIGRPLTQTECIQLTEMMRMYGQQIPCVYCYSESKRQAMKQYYTDFMTSRQAVLNAETDEEALEHMYGHATSKAAKESKDPAVALNEAAYKVFLEWRANRKSAYNPSLKMLWFQYSNDRNTVLSVLDQLYADGRIMTDLNDDIIAAVVDTELRINDKQAVKVVEDIVSEWKWDAIEGRQHSDYTPVDEDEWVVDPRTLSLWREMTAYAKSASQAKSVLRYVPYTDELKKLSQEQKDYINGMGGVRMHSSNDFRIDYVFDYFQFMADMAANKMFGHTYTKSPEFVRIFGNSGYKINMSIAAYEDENGNIRMNEDEGFNWDEAKRLREAFPNAGVMLMATSDNQIQMALDSDWIDMFIPFHASSLPKAVWYNMRMWQDYSTVQNEAFLNGDEMKAALIADGVELPKKIKAADVEKMYLEHFKIKSIIGITGKKKGKRLRPHFLPGPTVVDGQYVPGHNNDPELYKQLCMEYGVHPRFYGVKVKDAQGNTIDITEHPNYIKCIKETARTDSPQTPVQFNFDQPSEALGGKTPIEYAFDELQVRAAAEMESAGAPVRDIYKSLEEDTFGIVPQFIDTIIKHKEKTGKDYPLDYITPDSRKWFLTERRALEETYKNVETIPYHRNEYDIDGEPIMARVTEAAPVQGLESYTREELKRLVENHVANILSENDVDAEIVAVELHGSRGRGTAREDSDLDAVVEYSGDFREDDMFNLLNDEESRLVIDGISVDINPIRAEETGTMESYMKRSREYDAQKIEQQKALDFINGTKSFAEEGGDIRYSIRTKPAPKSTGIGYKVFFLKDGKLYPPMVANPDGADTPVGVWLDADAAPQAATSKTGRKKIKAGGKGTQGGSGTLAYRPGWHLGEIPYALQFNRGPKVDNPLGITGKNGKAIKVGKYFPANFVWAEVEYAKDVDYQDEAMSYGYNEAGNFQHSLAGLPKVPEDGSYTYRTNANPATDPWIITGAMKVNRILTDSEVDELVSQAGREPQEREVDEKAFEERMAVVNRDQKRADGQYADAAELDDIMFRLSNNNRATISKWLDKWAEARVDEVSKKYGANASRESFEEAAAKQKEEILNYLDRLNDSTMQLAWARWFCTGVVQMGAEDMPKVRQAVKIAKIHKVDPLQYDSPMAIIDQWPESIKEDPINPDEITTLHKVKELPDGIVIYDVDESEESRKNMREIINTHFGKDCSPWCLLQGDGNGKLTKYSADYWYKTYTAYTKQVAFKNGKLVAFSANSNEERLWWDRKDSSHRGIPVIGKIKGDKLGRSATMEYSPEDGSLISVTNIVKGNMKDGKYMEWFSLDNETPRVEVTFEHGYIVGRRVINYPNGQIRKDENYENGLLSGRAVTYFDDGQIETDANYVNGRLDGPFTSYHENGQVYYSGTYERGDMVGRWQTFYTNGQISKDEVYAKSGKPIESLTYYPDGSKKSESHSVSRPYGFGTVSEQEWDEQGRLVRSERMMESSTSYGYYDGDLHEITEYEYIGLGTTVKKVEAYQGQRGMTLYSALYFDDVLQKQTFIDKAAYNYNDVLYDEWYNADGKLAVVTVQKLEKYNGDTVVDKLKYKYDEDGNVSVKHLMMPRGLGLVKDEDLLVSETRDLLPGETIPSVDKLYQDYQAKQLNPEKEQEKSAPTKKKGKSIKESVEETLDGANLYMDEGMDGDISIGGIVNGQEYSFIVFDDFTYEDFLENGYTEDELGRATPEQEEAYAKVQDEIDYYKNNGYWRDEADEPMFRATEIAGNPSLIAVHNLNENNLLDAFDLGGFPMPSIAITKADIGHTDFGDISLVFDKETIYPKNQKNKVYSEDAWTPMFPKIGYKLNYDKTREISRRANEVGQLPLFNASNFDSVNYEDNIGDAQAKSLIDNLKKDYGAKQFFLAEQGNPVREYEMREVDKYTEEAVKRFNELLDKFGLETLKSVDENLTPEILQAVMDFLDYKNGVTDSFIKRIARQYVARAVNYATYGNKKSEVDYAATHRKIDERIDQGAFEKWLEDMFSGIVEKSGIRNDVEPYTSIGNRRAWEKLYDEVTLDNVVKAMSKKPKRGGSGLFGGNIFGAAAKTYNSIADIRKDAARRMAAVEPGEIQEQKQAILDRLSKVKVTNKELGITEMFDLTGNIRDAVAKSHTAEGIHRYLKDYYPDITMEAAQEIADIVKDIQSISTKYFEAKPYRAVGFDEVKLAVVPEGTSQAIVDGLQERGVPVRTYEKDNQQERMDVISRETEEMGLRFRAVEITPETRQEMEQIEAIARVNGTYLKAPNGADTKLTPEQWAMVRTKAFKDWFGLWENDPANASKVVDENGEPMVVYHGTNLTVANKGVPFWTFYKDQHFGTKGQAEEMARAGRLDSERKVYEVFLNIRNMKRVKDAPQNWKLTHSEYWEPIFNEAKADGYDGLVYLNEWEDSNNKSDSFVVFEPSQIKSATDNTGSFDPNDPDIRYRVIPGGASMAERTYRESGAFSFTGSEKISSIDDVAFIFRELQERATENSFLVLVKDGVPTILHTGIGSVSATTIDMTAAVAGYNDFKPDVVYMVHNHPSGNLYASRADRTILDQLRGVFNGVPVEGIILDTVSGNYGVFDQWSDTEREMPESGDEFPVKVLAFDKQVFDKEFRSQMNDRKVRGAEDVAAFLSAHRLGDGDKLGVLLLNHNNIIVANYVTNDNGLTGRNAEKIARQVADVAVHNGATATIMFGNFNFTDTALSKFNSAIKIASAGEISLLDVVQMDNYGNYHSVADGTLNGRHDGVMFRVTPEQDNAFQKAYEDKDVEAAQAILDKVAKAAGYRYKAYHGTPDGGFTVFGNSHRFGEIYFTDNEYIANSYKNDYAGENPTMYSSYLRMPNPLRYDAKRKSYNELANEGKIERLVSKARENGNGGVIIKNIYDAPSGWSKDPANLGTDYLVLGPSNIKSADPFTFDDNGNLIPLSERFNADNDDIRFRMSEDNSIFADNGISENGLDGEQLAGGSEGQTAEGTDYSSLGASNDGTTVRGRGPVEVLFRMVGQEAVKNMPEEESLRAQANLNIANQMKADGKSAQAILDATGWQFGKDGKPRLEEPDFTKEQVGVLSNYDGKTGMPLKDLIDDERLFTEYPSLKDWNIGWIRGYDASASADFNRNRIIIGISKNLKAGAEYLNEGDPRAYNGRGWYRTYTFTKEGRRSLLHEIQHVIQNIEGFAPGANSDYIAARIGKHLDRIRAAAAKIAQMELDTYDTPEGRALVEAVDQKLDKETIKARKEALMKTDIFKEGKKLYDQFVHDFSITPAAWGIAEEAAAHRPKNVSELDSIATSLYMLTSGEVEARTVEKRMDMKDDQRRSRLFSASEDVPREAQWNLPADSKYTAKEDVMFSIKQKDVVNKAMSGLQNFNDDEINDMLMDTFEAVTPEIRAKIVDNAPETGYDFGKATVRTFADLAEREDDLTAEEWNAIATLRDNMKDALGIDVLSLNDTLWSMYQTSTFGERDILSAARRAIVADKLGHSPADEAKRQQAEDELRFSIREGMESTSAAEMYNRATNYWMDRLKESYVDMNESVNDLVAAIEKATGIDAEAFEDVRLALNQQSSKGLAAMTKYTADYLEPLWSAIHDVMAATGMSYDDVVRYVMLKHAVERNDVFARRDAKAFYQAEFDKVVNPLRKHRKELERDRKKALATGDLMTANDCDNKIQAIDLQIAAEQKKLDRHNKMVDNGTAAKYHEYRENDYGGLTSMYSEYPGLQPREYYKTDEEYNQAARKVRKPLYQTVGEMEVSALGEVDAMEQRTSGDEFDKLWEKINAATKATLESQYKSNVISKAQYDAARDQFQYYVPLRGFKDTTAEDIWTYFNASHSGSFSPALLGARGRKSEAENPFNWIGTMASSAIAQNLKNESKMALYYFIANRPNQDLVSVKDVWYRFDDAATSVYQAANPGSKKRIFTAVYPPFNESLDTDAAKQAYDIWEESMEQQAQIGLAYRGTNKLDIKDDVAFIDAKEAPQHIIRMKLRGKDVSLIINGNPRAAQAINGLLNIETEGGYQKLFGPILRWMSAVNTSYNPEFWISNMQRDLLFASMGMDIKGDGASNLFKNLVNPKKIMKMMKAYEDGTLGNSEVENYYREFAESGAITGFTVVSGNETWEKEIANFLDPSVLTKIKDSKFMKFWQNLGEAVEQMTRFSAYMTARKSGKDIIGSTNAAKEITVNFNRKGSGRHISVDELKTLTTKSGRHLNDAEKAAVFVMSLVPAYGRRMIMFFNAATQGLNAMYKLWKKNPKRFAGWMTGYFAVGVMQAVLHALLDDDDDYMDMPEYTKRNNLLLGYDGIYLKWAMPQEARMFYAFGDMAVNHIMGRTPNKILAGEMLSAMADVMPLSATDGVTGLLPSAAQPFIELYTNKDFTGARIYNDMRFLSEDERSRTPNHPNALPNTGKIFVNVSKVLNEISGGNDWDAGFINIHPEAIQHVVEGAGGGLLRTLNKVYETVGGAIDAAAGVPITGEELSVRRFPFLNRLLEVNDERSRNSHVSELFYYYKSEAEHTKSKISKFQKNGDSDAMSDLIGSKEFEIYKIYMSYEKLMRSFDDQIKIEEDKDEKKALMREQDQYRKDMIREISELD